MEKRSLLSTQRRVVHINIYLEYLRGFGQEGSIACNRNQILISHLQNKQECGCRKETSEVCITCVVHRPVARRAFPVTRASITSSRPSPAFIPYSIHITENPLYSTHNFRLLAPTNLLYNTLPSFPHSKKKKKKTTICPKSAERKNMKTMKDRRL